MTGFMTFRSFIATPTEMFKDFNSFQNMSDRVVNPVTLQAVNILTGSGLAMIYQNRLLQNLTLSMFIF